MHYSYDNHILILISIRSTPTDFPLFVWYSHSDTDFPKIYSPIKHEKKMLEMIGKKLKKNNVAVDIVNFGEEDEGKNEKLEALLNAVNNNDTSHMVQVPSGPNALSDVLIRLVVQIYF